MFVGDYFNKRSGCSGEGGSGFGWMSHRHQNTSHLWPQWHHLMEVELNYRSHTHHILHTLISQPLHCILR